jgi:hypothetical protein
MQALDWNKGLMNHVEKRLQKQYIINQFDIAMACRSIENQQLSL